MDKTFEIFEVKKLGDWQAVADYMLRLAAENPLAESDIANASMSEAEAIERVEKLIQEGRSGEIAKYTCAVIHRMTGKPICISLVMTSEPGTIHLSAVGVMPSHVEGQPGTMYRLNDIIVGQMTDNILGGVSYEERSEGDFSQVRNFYKQLS